MTQTKQFSKNDEGFICAVCGLNVPPLKTTSRDHCTNCLHSLHVDVFPGDRANNCLGVLVPVDLETHSKKGYVINYKCAKCGQKHKNKAAPDDNIEAIIKLTQK